MAPRMLIVRRKQCESGRNSSYVTMAQCLNYSASAFSVAAAVLWFLSALVKTPGNFNIIVDISAATWDGSVGGTGARPELSALAQALGKQARWSRWATGCAGIAAIASACSALSS